MNQPAILVTAHETDCSFFTGHGPRCRPYVRLLTPEPEWEVSTIPRPAKRLEMSPPAPEAVPVYCILASLGLTFGSNGKVSK